MKKSLSEFSLSGFCFLHFSFLPSIEKFSKNFLYLGKVSFLEKYRATKQHTKFVFLYVANIYENFKL